MKAPAILGLIAILTALAWPFFARPRGALLIIVPALATIISGALATKLWLTVDTIVDRGRPHDYALAAERDGQHVLPVRSVPGVPGMQVRLLANDASAAPLSWAQVEACDWRVRWRGRDMTSDGTCFHLPNYDGGLCLADSWLADVAPNGEQFEVAYVVNEQTRPVVRGLKLRVMYPFTYGNDLAMGGTFSTLAGLLFAGLAVVGVVATLVGRLRTRAARASVSPPEDPK